ncbi:DUF4312 family protein [Paraliobacillus sp. JSM ZJ581]|uniref:DUF4312 family protein n=1 Tax=Paraliobacillus sp. JSM ZJ581 TaxID=3342118 RepID=UPI0035A96DF8
MMETKETIVTVSGKGNTKEEAVSQALSTIQKKLFADLDQLIIKAEPVEIEVVETSVEEYTERFMFFFLPRKKMKCVVTLNVHVSLKTLDVNQMNWTKKK